MHTSRTPYPQYQAALDLNTEYCRDSQDTQAREMDVRLLTFPEKRAAAYPQRRNLSRVEDTVLSSDEARHVTRLVVDAVGNERPLAACVQAPPLRTRRCLHAAHHG